MTYISLGSRTASTALDQTGFNPGNVTSAFTPTILGIPQLQFEVYHMVVTNVPSGSMGNIYIGSREWGFTFPNSGTEWDPSQPMLLGVGQEMDVMWNISATTSSSSWPMVTAWLRYDPSVPGNNT
jgi:hypothetical protein